jgi:hypothetical protein
MLSGSPSSANSSLEEALAKSEANARERKALNAMLSGSPSSANSSLEEALAKSEANSGKNQLTQANLNRKAKILSSC